MMCRQETKNVEPQGKISFLQKLQVKYYNNAEPQALHCIGSTNCNHIQLNICTLLFFKMLCLPPRTPYEKQMFSQNRGLSVQIPQPHLVSILQTVGKAVPTVPFQGACEIPLRFLPGMQKHRVIIVTKTEEHTSTKC